MGEENDMLTYDEILKRFEQIYINKPYLRGTMTDEQLRTHIVAAANRWANRGVS